MKHSPSQLSALCREDPLVRARLRETGMTLGAEGLSLLLVDETQTELRFCVAEGLNAEALTGGGNWEKAFRVPLSHQKGINSLAVLMGKALCLHGMDERHNKEVDDTLRQTTHSMMVVPLTAGGEIVGTLSVINPHALDRDESQYKFGAKDMDLIYSTADDLSRWIGSMLEGGEK